MRAEGQGKHKAAHRTALRGRIRVELFVYALVRGRVAHRNSYTEVYAPQNVT